MDKRYTGHGARTGGLQGHSVGDLYPYTLMAQGRPESLTWFVMDTRTGNLSRGFRTASEAQAQAVSLKIRNMLWS